MPPTPRSTWNRVLSPAWSSACTGRERCLPGYRVERSGYVCHAIELVVKGKGTLVLAGKRHRLQPGRLFSYGPGVAHVIETDPHQPLVKYVVDFFGREAPRACAQAGVAPASFMAVNEIEALRHLFEELVHEAQKAGDRRIEIVQTYLRLILLKAGERSSLSAPPAPSRALDTAARLLATEPVVVKEAAAAAGFEDALHFSRVFRKTLGCRPSEFQERHRASIAQPRKT